jgi:rfaE bifunctional protein kinase chain/domain
MSLTIQKLSKIFATIKNLKVAVIGDFAVDFYYEINLATNEKSVESGKEVFWATNPKTSLGGAGNVCANLAALGVKNVKTFGIIGNDIFGREIMHLFEMIGANCENILQLNDWNTCTYTKPIDNSQEQNRIDFGTNNECMESDFDQLLMQLDKQLESLDLLIVNQQFAKPFLTENRIRKLNKLFEKHPNCTILADLRSNGLSIRNSILKVNVAELAGLLNINELRESNEKDCEFYLKKLSDEINCQILLTRGEYGVMFYDKDVTNLAIAIKIENEIDTVGAGDTVVASFASAYQSGTSIMEALEIANWAAAVSIQKLKQTGTASEAEILKLIEITNGQN